MAKPQPAKTTESTEPSFRCEWWSRGQRPVAGELASLSILGAYIRTGEPCQVDSVVWVRFHLCAVPFELQAKVIHQTGGISAMGVEFVGLAPERRSILGEAISKAIK